MPQTLDVVFRASRGRHPEITACFPTEPADLRGTQFTCYAHIGQHSGASWGWYQTTRAAKPEEYADLLAELRQIYEQDGDEPVRLIVRQRVSRAMRDAFNANWRKMSRPGC